MNQYTKELIENMLEIQAENARLHQEIMQLKNYLDDSEEEEIKYAEKWQDKDIRGMVSARDIRRIFCLEMPFNHKVRLERLRNAKGSDENK